MLSKLDSRKMAASIKNTSIKRANKNSFRNPCPRKQEIQKNAAVDETVHRKIMPKVRTPACLSAGLIIKDLLHSLCYIQL